jgi:PBSX family phage terminase large subunit
MQRVLLPSWHTDNIRKQQEIGNHVTPVYMQPAYRFLVDTHKRYKVISGGRGSGKTHSIVRALLIKCLESPISVLCTRQYKENIKQSIGKLWRKIIAAYALEDFADLQEKKIVFKNGSEITYFGFDRDSHKIKGTEDTSIVWLEEADVIKEDAFIQLRDTVRKADSEIWISYNPLHEHDYIHKLFAIDSYSSERLIYKHTTYKNNPFFKDTENYHDMLADKQNNYAKYLHIWEGHCKSDAENALITQAEIDELRMPIGDVPNLKDMSEIIISVDPAVSSSETADETGIIVIARDTKAIYLLEDASMKAAPEKWVQKIISLYDKYDANCILYEDNQGGKVIELAIKSTLESHGRFAGAFKLEAVRAVKDKMARFSQVIIGYNNKTVHHVGKQDNYMLLERQMTTYTGAKGQKSPDRLDALVHGLKYHLDSLKKPQFKANLSLKIPRKEITPHDFF